MLSGCSILWMFRAVFTLQADGALLVPRGERLSICLVHQSELTDVGEVHPLRICFSSMLKYLHLADRYSLLSESWCLDLRNLSFEIGIGLFVTLLDRADYLSALRTQFVVVSRDL
jgi:hypothetical protein